MRSPEPVVVLIARWHVRKESVRSVLALVTELRQRSLEEPGCLGYEALQVVGAPDAIVLIERFADTVALEAHRNTKHYGELLVESVLPMLSARRLELLRPCETVQ